MTTHVETKQTYRLEMRLEDFRPKRISTAELEIRRVGVACPEYNWFLHQSVGVDYRWGGRETWGPAEWQAHVDRPELETWVAYVSGTPAGYYELERQPDESIRILCFGLRRPFLGQGLGAHLLTEAVQRCWHLGATRVWLTTCSHDHPHALDNYKARGFRLLNQTQGRANPPRESALFGR
jgi:GNAT superfamily N-acetyltransferase